MSIFSLIGAGVSLATEVFKHFNEKDSREYTRKLLDYHDKLSLELAKPLDEQDDSLIELLTEKINHLQTIALSQVKNAKNYN